MGALRFFVALAESLNQNPQQATAASLDELAAAYSDFAYIGNRKSLESLVQSEAAQLKARLDAMSNKDLARFKSRAPEIISVVDAVRGAKDATQVIQNWLGRDWKKDSGVFPDFLFGSDGSETLGNGALLELKDSKGDSIASFNSTIPTRYKSLENIRKITGSSLVSNAAMLYDFPISVADNYVTRWRSCFYLVRTRAKAASQVRISLVEGSFFETMPKDKLLQAVWGQLLEAVGIAGVERDRIVESLGELEQNEIAQSREITGASVRPRFRLMAEVHPDGNIHRYPEITPRTLNLVIKKEHDNTWLGREFARDNISARLEPAGGETFVRLNENIQIRLLTVNHKRNGEHLVLQLKLEG